MVMSSSKTPKNKWDSLDTQLSDRCDRELWCMACGGLHLSQDHWRFMAEDMPQNPVEMIDDLAKMGFYKPDTFKIANAINTADLRKELFLKIAGRNNPKREKLILELAKQAGGLENAFAAAFGAKAGEFLGMSLPEVSLVVVDF